jgi:hypothetical protein
MRRRVLLDHGRFDAQKRLDELARVCNRRGGEQELGFGAIDRCGASQPAENVGHVRAEHSSVDVRLVHDHVAEVLEHVAPAVVVREYAHVEHVRVCEDDIGPFTDLPTALGLGVAVVDRRAQARKLERGERTRLVLGQGLRRVQVERSELRLLRERVQDWEVEREGLSARGSGRDDDVLAAFGGVERGGLVAVEAVEAEPVKRVEDTRVQPVRDRDDIRPLRRISVRYASSSASRSSFQVTIATGAMLASPAVIPAASRSRARIPAGVPGSRPISRRSPHSAVTA